MWNLTKAVRYAVTIAVLQATSVIMRGSLNVFITWLGSGAGGGGGTAQSTRIARPKESQPKLRVSL